MLIQLFKALTLQRALFKSVPKCVKCFLCGFLFHEYYLQTQLLLLFYILKIWSAHSQQLSTLFFHKAYFIISILAHTASSMHCTDFHSRVLFLMYPLAGANLDFHPRLQFMTGHGDFKSSENITCWFSSGDQQSLVIHICT